MKKYLLIPFCYLLIAGFVRSNSGIYPLVPPDCYTDNKNKGDSLSRIGNYDLAIKQYQVAKYCLNATPQQKKILDDLIADMIKRKAASEKKVNLIKKF